MKLKKSQVEVLNIIAKGNMERANTMLMGVNLALETEYFFLNKRVTFIGEDGHQHDAWVNAEE